MSDNMHIAIGVFLGILFPAIILYYTIVDERPPYYEQQLHIACLNGGGIWENGNCVRPNEGMQK